MRAKQTIRARSGFTLLELILAVTITAVVSAALFTSLSGAFRARQKIEDNLSGRDSARAVLAMMRTDLQCVPPAGGRISGVFEGVDERGAGNADADQLSYVTANVSLASSQDVADLRQVELRLVTTADDPDYFVLTRRVTGNLLATVTPQPEVQVLARRIVSMNVQYFDGGEWVDEWDSAEQDNEIPQAVEIVLVTAPILSKTPEDQDDLLQTYLTTSQIVRLPAAPEVESSGINRSSF